MRCQKVSRLVLLLDAGSDGPASSLVSLFPPVFVTLTCAFRYGREDLDVLGLTFRKDLFMANSQTFPSPPDPEKSLSRLQERLMKKLGEHAHPFTFEVASQPSSCTGWVECSRKSRTWMVDQRDSGGSSILDLSLPAPCPLRFL